MVDPTDTVLEQQNGSVEDGNSDKIAELGGKTIAAEVQHATPPHSGSPHAASPGAEGDETASTDDGHAETTHLSESAGASEIASVPGAEAGNDLNSGFCATPKSTLNVAEAYLSKQQNAEAEERSFTTASQALDAAEAARTKGNVAYSLGHLYNAISMYLLANRQLAYATSLETGALNVEAVTGLIASSLDCGFGEEPSPV